MKPRIIIFSKKYPPDYYGPANQVHQISERLTKKGFYIEVATWREKKKIERMDHIIVHAASEPKIKGKIGFIFFILSEMLRLIRFSRKFDIVHVLNPFYHGVVISVVSQLLRKPVVVKYSLAHTLQHGKKNIKKKLRRLILRKSANMIAISTETYQELIDGGFKPSKIKLIPNGVDTRLFSPIGDDKKRNQLREELDLKSDDFIGLFVGAFNYRKGVDDLLKIWCEVVKTDKNAKLLIIGNFPDISFLNVQKKFIAEMNLTENIRFLGLRERINIYYQIADLFLFCSRQEGLPNALMEAMSTGLSCITRNIGGVNDLIVHERNGYLFDGNDYEFREKVVSTVLKIKNNQIHKDQIGQEARHYISNNFSMNKTVQEYERFYLNMI